MPKVGTERVYHKGSGKDMFININFTMKQKLFHAVNMPEEVIYWYASKLNSENPDKHYTGEITANTYDECVDLAKKVYNDYYSLQVKEEKTIFYRLQANSPGKEEYGKKKYEIRGAPIYALGVEFEVAYKIWIGDAEYISFGTYEQSRQPENGFRTGGFQLKQRGGHLDKYKDFKEIPYTETMEEFFKTVTSGLDAMIDKVIDFFGNDPELLIEKINQGKLLN